MIFTNFICLFILIIQIIKIFKTIAIKYGVKENIYYFLIYIFFVFIFHILIFFIKKYDNFKCFLISNLLFLYVIILFEVLIICFNCYTNIYFFEIYITYKFYIFCFIFCACVFSIYISLYLSSFFAEFLIYVNIIIFSLIIFLQSFSQINNILNYSKTKQKSAYLNEHDYIFHDVINIVSCLTSNEILDFQKSLAITNELETLQLYGLDEKILNIIYQKYKLITILDSSIDLYLFISYPLNFLNDNIKNSINLIRLICIFLDNAIEYLCNSQIFEKSINFKILKVNTHIEIIIENTYNKLIRKKVNKKNKGLGLKSAKNIENNDNSIKIITKITTNLFSQKIILSLL